LLERSEHADGVKIFIGGESELVPLDECSVVTAPYEVDGRIVGTVGVIGPTRMAYERVIPDRGRHREAGVLRQLSQHLDGGSQTGVLLVNLGTP
jgi:hypothetical protein